MWQGIACSKVRDRALRLLGRMGLWTKVFLVLLLLLVSTLLTAGWSYYRTLSDQVLSHYEKDMYLSLKQANTIMDLKLLSVVAASELVMQDAGLMRVFESLDSADPYALMAANREIKRILAKYMQPASRIYSYGIVTDYFRFGEGYLPYDRFIDSAVCEAILEANGALVWYPTYDFVEQYDQGDLRGADVADFRYLFAAGRVMNLFEITIQGSAGSVRRPTYDDVLVFLVNFRESFFREGCKMLTDEGSSVAIVAPDGRQVAAIGPFAGALLSDGQWTGRLVGRKRGSETRNVDDERVAVSYDTSQVTGWTLIAATPTALLLNQASSQLAGSLVQFVLPLALISLALAVLVSVAVTRPLNRLLHAFNRTGGGDFQSHEPVRGYGEFATLMRRFNDMNDDIGRLIDENYNIKIHEKDAQLEALSAQLNPHFIYNTLNLINCIAIEEGNAEITRIVRAMSAMLRYTADNPRSEGQLRVELEWLSNYVFIMSQRYEGRFVYASDVDALMLEEQVPRMLLQPFVENAFVHGFRDMEENCTLSVRGYREADRRCFEVCDNGCGLTETSMAAINEGSGGSVGINNIRVRLRIMYGEDNCGIHFEPGAGGVGTLVRIWMPDGQ